MATTCLVLRASSIGSTCCATSYTTVARRRLGSLNRQQVEAGAAVMARLIPTFIGVIIDNPNADWGVPYYPPV